TSNSKRLNRSSVRLAGDELTLARDECNHPQGAAGAIHDLQWGSDHNCAGQRQKIEIGEAGQSKLAVAVHDEVIAEGRVEAGDLSGVCADGLTTGALRNCRFVAFSIAAPTRGPSAADLCRYSSADV